MANLKKKQMSHTEEGWKMLEDIMSAKCFTNLNEAFRNCISFTHSKYFPEYVQVARERASATPEQKAEKSIEKQEAILSAKEKKAKDEAERKLADGREICLTLRGEEFPDANGVPKCRYLSYGWLNPKNAWVNERVKYMDELTLEDADLQYYVDRTKPAKPMPADQVLATLVELGLTDNVGKPL